MARYARSTGSRYRSTIHWSATSTPTALTSARNHYDKFEDLDRLGGWGLDDEVFEVVGVFSVDTDWAKSYEAGDLSEDEYLEQVHETIE